MTEFKEIGAPKENDYSEKNRETDHPAMREEVPKQFQNVEFDENPFADSTDVYYNVFKDFGLISDVPERKNVDRSENTEAKNSSGYLEQGSDGKYYDKETGKGYDSTEAWGKAQETLAKRYDSTSKYFEEKANREWAYFKNADKNGETQAEKWKHYQSSQECYAKTKEYKEKAEKIWNKLENTNSGFDKNS